jgi:hypothetical protein
MGNLLKDLCILSGEDEVLHTWSSDNREYSLMPRETLEPARNFATACVQQCRGTEQFNEDC